MSRKLKILASVLILGSSHSFSAPMMDNKPCACHKIPSRFGQAMQSLADKPNLYDKIINDHVGMTLIPSGTFMMGGNNDQARPDELPLHQIKISPFWLDTTQVTNSEFEKFVVATKYITTAEKKPDWDELKKQLPPDTPKPDESKLVAASLVFTPPDHAVSFDDFSQWWSWMPGADWKHPHGPSSELSAKENNNPVVQVSWDDANAYCHWLGKRLPTEAEWEWAAHGGLNDSIYPWGNEPIDQGKIKANTWQGKFPYKNTLEDHYYYTSPVKTYAANGYGLYDMAGNVWEWVSDWYSADYYKSLSGKTVVDPQGPSTSLDPDEPYSPKKVLKGGSYLCNEAYCSGYRVAARMKSPTDTSMEHVGFRCAS